MAQLILQLIFHFQQFNIGSGLINKRNNCFLNATLQALFHVPVVRSSLQEDLVHVKNCKIRECITCMFLDLFETAQSSKVPCSPFRLYGALKKIKNNLSELLNGQQQDSHEFLILLTQVLEKQPHSGQWFQNNFVANIATHVNCTSCGKVHQSCSRIADFALHLQGNQSIQTALDSYFSYDEIEYLCVSCKTYDTVKKKHFLLSAPDCLCLQLRRFSERGEKMNDEIEISSELCIRKYFLKTQAVAWKYKLVAVVNHFGQNRNMGHYNTIVLKPNDVYYEFDDRTVRQVSSNLVSGKNAYLVFYELITVKLFIQEFSLFH